MRAQKECFTCLLNQAKVWSEEVGESYLSTLPREKSGEGICPPPQIAIELYAKLAQNKGVQDLYANIKAECIAKAHDLTKDINPLLLTPKESIKLSALGNVIDYGSASSFEIQDFDFKREVLDFVCFDFEAFEQKAKEAKTLLILADNAGENLFDEIMIASLKHHYPHLEFFYFVRGYPIINDLTLKDLEHPYSQKIFSLAQVVDSGVRSPGFIYSSITPNAKKIYDSADLIIAKGMGNYECMEDTKDQRVFFLLKIKCQVVANHLGFPLGKMIFKQNL